MRKNKYEGIELTRKQIAALTIDEYEEYADSKGWARKFRAGVVGWWERSEESEPLTKEKK